jgi:DNA-binding transcriptional ArsR family regulator
MFCIKIIGSYQSAVLQVPERAREECSVSAKRKQSGEPTGSAAKGKKGANLSLQQRLVKALAHPLRVTILDYMNGGEWSPRELERETGQGLSQVSYHVKVLLDYELIELTRTEPRRGAVEHFYRAIERAFVPAGMTNNIPKSAQRIIGDGIVGKIDKDVAASLKSGKFYARNDWHTSWTPVPLDSKGCEDAEELADEFVERYLKLEAETTNRQAEAENPEELIWTSAALLIFGSELGEKEKAATRKGKTSRKKPSKRKKRG